MTITPDQTTALTMHVRIPGWARNEPVPSDLYRLADRNTESVVLKVNGKPVPIALDKGYVNLTRTWKKGDTVELSMPMPVRRVLANDRVAADRGRVAIQRGPIVYAAEWVDNPDGKVRNLMLSDSAKLTAEYRPALLNGVEVVTGKAVALAYDAQGQVVKHQQDLTMIPYYAWANRGRGQMTVWLPNIESAARPLPYPTMVTTAKVVVSGRPQQRNVDVIKDGEIPAASNDHASYFDWYPARGNQETVDYTFAQPAKVAECGLYWFDDTGQGSVRVPASWRLLYKDGDQWKPVETQGSFGVAKDQFNSVKFTPVTTTALRVELQAQPNFAIGMQKWTVK
jgi:hypothetical protein